MAKITEYLSNEELYEDRDSNGNQNSRKAGFRHPSWPARLKALRFHLVGIAARVIEHGRRPFLKIGSHHPTFHHYKEAREKLLLFYSA